MSSLQCFVGPLVSRFRWKSNRFRSQSNWREDKFARQKKKTKNDLKKKTKIETNHWKKEVHYSKVGLVFFAF